jgi:Cation efflux system protein CusB domain 1
MTQTPLYRPEVLEAKRNRWLGRLVLRQPISHWAMTWLALATAAMAVAFLYVGEYARKVRIEGQLVDTPPLVTPALAHRGADGGAAVLKAHLVLPERLLASTAVGAEVLLRYPAFPYQRYGQYRGTIVAISRTPLSSAPSGAVASPPIVYRATVALERQRVRDEHGNERSLQPGLGVQADVIVEKRRLYEWLFEPFLRLRERLSGSPNRRL